MNNTYLPLLAERFLGRPLLIAPALAEMLYSVLEGRISPAAVSLPAPERLTIDPEASRFIGQRARPGGGYRLNRVKGSTALITIDGPLVNRGAFIGQDMCTGMTSYEGIAAQVAEAEADDEIENVVLDINSGGGEANGMFTAAAAIRKLAKRKYVVAVINDVAASAAFGLASAADEITISPTSLVGSIGVVMIHMDRSVEMAAKGLRPTLIHSGAHKVDGNPFGPLPEGVRADLQRDADTFYDRFVETVEQGRGKSRFSAKAARSTEARTFIGQAAIDTGLADRVATVEDVLAEISRPKKRVGYSSSTTPRSNAVLPDANNGGPAAAIDVSALVMALAPALTTALAPAFADAMVSALQTAGVAPKADAPKTAEQAVTDDRARVAAIFALTEAQGRPTLAGQLAAQGMSAEAAKPILAGQPVEAGIQPAPGSAANLNGREIGADASVEKPSAEAAKAGWGKAIAGVNKKRVK